MTIVCVGGVNGCVLVRVDECLDMPSSRSSSCSSGNRSKQQQQQQQQQQKGVAYRGA